MKANCGLLTTAGAPQRRSFAPGQVQQLSPSLVSVRHRLLAPDMSPGTQRLVVEPTMLLHVGEIDQQIELGPG